MKVKFIFVGSGEVVKWNSFFYRDVIDFTWNIRSLYGEITYQDNLIIREDFTINPNQSATYSHNFNDTTCSGTYKITRMDPSDIIVGLYNDTVKLKLKIARADNNTHNAVYNGLYGNGWTRFLWGECKYFCR